MCLPNGQPEILLFSWHNSNQMMIRHQTIGPYIHSIGPVLTSRNKYTVPRIPAQLLDFSQPTEGNFKSDIKSTR
jgi:hypothetical protein